ncbi:hypothetical protein HJG60_011578 [Phyllostomus discolor]|uniref:Uncharacterized protein n=1 Tax=Phyllostomus discolor TaxID=89673 RepID=A0A834E394_9CHIR|nr:hypothetical protein HJG60_011578 [Phyllostomus discolor]
MGREEGAPMRTRPQRQPLQTDILLSVATVGARQLAQLPQALGCGQARAAYMPHWPITSGLPLPLPPNDPPPRLTPWVPAPAWELAREGLCGLWLDKDSETQSRTNHTARHQHREPGEGEASPKAGGGGEPGRQDGRATPGPTAQPWLGGPAAPR